MELHELPLGGQVEAIREDAPAALKEFQEWFQDEPFRAVVIWLDLVQGDPHFGLKEWRRVGFEESNLTNQAKVWIKRIRDESFQVASNKPSWQSIFVSRALEGQYLLQEDGRAARYLLGEKGKATIPDARSLLKVVAGACGDEGSLRSDVDADEVAREACEALKLTPNVVASRLLIHWGVTDREHARVLHGVAVETILDRPFDVLDQCIHGILLHHEFVQRQIDDQFSRSDDGTEPLGVDEAAVLESIGRFLVHVRGTLVPGPEPNDWDLARGMLDGNTDLAIRLFDIHNGIVPERHQISCEDLERDRVRRRLLNSGDPWLAALVSALEASDRQLKARARSLVEAYERSPESKEGELRKQVMESFKAHHRELWAEVATSELLGGSSARRLETALVGVMLIHALADGGCNGTLRSFDSESKVHGWLSNRLLKYSTKAPDGAWPPIREREASLILSHAARSRALESWRTDLEQLGVPIRGPLKEAFEFLDREYSRLRIGLIAIAPPAEWAAGFFRAAFESAVLRRSLTESDPHQTMLDLVLQRLGLASDESAALQALCRDSQVVQDLEWVIAGASDPPVPDDSGVAPALDDVLVRAIRSEGGESASEQRVLRLRMVLHWIVARSDSEDRDAEHLCWDSRTSKLATQSLEGRLGLTGRKPSPLDKPLLRMGRERIELALARFHDHPASTEDKEVVAVAALDPTPFRNLVTDWSQLADVPEGVRPHDKIFADHRFGLTFGGVAMLSAAAFLLYEVMTMRSAP